MIMNKIKTREEIIESMCVTHSHDFGLDKTADNPFCGMDEKEREGLRITMRRILDNDIYPQMVLRETSSNLLKIEEFMNGLKVIVWEYDKKRGTYPKSQFEGLEIFGFALEYFGLEAPEFAMNEFVEKYKDLYI